VSDTLPAGATLVATTPDTCFGGAVLTCALGSIDSGAAKTLRITLRTTAAGALANTASVSAEQDDPDAADATDTHGVTVSPCTIRGTARANVLNGTAGADVICGLGGNDRINGKGGNDLILGGAGADTLVGGAGRDTLRGEAGNDLLEARDRARDTVDGGAGRDRGRLDRRLDSRKSVEVLL
jgi:Ca2+-binding RTX toxin-like protein